MGDPKLLTMVKGEIIVRVLITGITGFAGSHLVDHILENTPDVQISGIKRWRSPMDNLTHIKNHLDLYDSDLTDLSSLIYVINETNPDVIFHLAAQSYVPISYVAPVDTLMTNVIGTANLLEAVRINKIDPVIHICSSSEVYGQVRKEDVPIREECPFRPMSPYAISKVAEDMLGWQYYVSWKMKTIRTRAFSHTGPRRGDVFVTSNFAEQIARIELGVQSPTIRVGNLDSVRTFADVRDIVRAYWTMVEKFFEGKVAAGAVYNIGGQTTITIREILDMLLDCSQVKDKVSIEIDPTRIRPADVTLQIPCVDKFKADTGWEPVIPLSTTLLDLLNYWREKTRITSI